MTRKSISTSTSYIPYSSLTQFIHRLITVNIIKGEIPPPPPDTSSQALAQTGKDAIEQFINIYTDPTQPGPTIDPGLIIPPPARPYVPQLPVCIIGAGVSGLYIAMMLDSLGIKYELMEGSGRTGGRLYTHNFPKNAGKYQYYVSNIFD